LSSLIVKECYEKCGSLPLKKRFKKTAKKEATFEAASFVGFAMRFSSYAI
jgi:hypothetical protein